MGLGIGTPPPASGVGCRDWLAAVQAASYKGVSFEVEDDTRAGGRRIVSHEYPSRETWDNEDLGKRMEAFSVTGYVTGDDAEKQAERLFQKCTSPGPGLLILPLRLPMQARCVNIQSTFVADMMGRMPVVMEFVVESEQRGGIFSSTFLRGAVEAAVALGAAAISSNFSISFDTVVRGFSSVGFVPAVARTTAGNEITRIAKALDRARMTVPVTPPIDSSKVDYAIRAMLERSNQLAFRGQKPNRYEADMYVADQAVIKSGIAGLVDNTIRRIAEKNNEPEQAFSAMRVLSTYEAQGIDKPVIVPRSVRAEEALTQELASLTRRHALVRMAGTSSRQRYRTRADAVTARARLAQAFNIEMEAVSDSKLSDAMGGVLERATNYLTQSAEALPSTIRLRTQWPLPACVVATALYNDSAMDADLLARNGPTHPLFMPEIVEALAEKPRAAR